MPSGPPMYSVPSERLGMNSLAGSRGLGVPVDVAAGLSVSKKDQVALRQSSSLSQLFTESLAWSPKGPQGRHRRWRTSRRRTTVKLCPLPL